MSTVTASCAFMWEEAGEVHTCGVRVYHTLHMCEDDDGCAATMIVAVGGGRKRTGRTRKSGGTLIEPGLTRDKNKYFKRKRVPRGESKKDQKASLEASEVLPSI